MVPASESGSFPWNLVSSVWWVLVRVPVYKQRRETEKMKSPLMYAVQQSQRKQARLGGCFVYMGSVFMKIPLGFLDITMNGICFGWMYEESSHEVLSHAWVPTIYHKGNGKCDWVLMCHCL